nr:hypothetical protein DA06_18025 [Georgenia sp. SUBG003]
MPLVLPSVAPRASVDISTGAHLREGSAHRPPSCSWVLAELREVTREKQTGRVSLEETGSGV